MRFSLKNFKKDLIVTWGFSYVLIISIMLVAMTIISLIFNSTSKKISDDFNDYIFETVTSDVNDTLLSMNNIYLDITQNANIISLVSSADLYTQSETYDFIDDLKSYNQYAEYINGAFIYIKDTDTVISASGISSAYLYYISYFNPDKISFEDWKQQFTNNVDTLQYSSVPFKDQNSRNIDALTLQFPIPRTKNNWVGVVLSDKKHFMRGLEEIRWENLCDIYIYNRSGNLAAYSKKSEKGEIPQNLRQLSDYENDRNVIHSSDIVVNGHAWKVVTITPNGAIDRNLVLMQSIIILIILGSLIILFFVVRNILNNNYRPIKTMLSFFNITENTNEYENLFASIDNALKKNISMSKELDSHNRNLKKINLAKMLRGEIVYIPDENLDLVFRGEYFVVISFFLEKISDLFNDDKNMTEPEKLSHLSFIIDNVISELMDKLGAQVFTTEIDGLVVCLANLKDNTSSEEIKNLADQGRDFINRSFDIALTYTLSCVCEGVLSIPVAYSQTCEVLDHLRMLGIEEPMQYIATDNSMIKSKYIFDFHKEQSLANSIKTGNHQTALEVLNSIFTELENQKELPFDYVIYVILDVASTITKAANDILPSEIDFNDTLIFYRKIKDGESLINLYTQMSEYIVKLCKTIKKDLQEGKNRVYFLISHIEKYISDNYSDPNLNINSIGVHFNINPDYISTTFKKETGKSLLTYINYLRIDRAKDLIKEGRYSKKEIAKMVGFTTERNFYRVLKKYEEEKQESQ